MKSTHLDILCYRYTNAHLYFQLPSILWMPGTYSVTDTDRCNEHINYYFKTSELNIFLNIKSFTCSLHELRALRVVGRIAASLYIIYISHYY